MISGPPPEVTFAVNGFCSGGTRVLPFGAEKGNIHVRLERADFHLGSNDKELIASVASGIYNGTSALEPARIAGHSTRVYFGTVGVQPLRL